MSIKPRTIDNLGKEASQLYAENQRQLQGAPSVEEARFIQQTTEIPVTKPYIPSEFERLFASAKTAFWAFFSPVSVFAARLFTHQLIPSLGDSEELLDKLSSLKLKPEEETERQRLISLLTCIQSLDKLLTLANTRRNQHHRG